MCYSFIVSFIKYVMFSFRMTVEIIDSDLLKYHRCICLWTFYILENFSLGKSSRKSYFHSYDTFPLSSTDKSTRILRTTRCRCQASGFQRDVIFKEQRLRLKDQVSWDHPPPTHPVHRPPKPTKGSLRDDTALTLLQKRSQLICQKMRIVKFEIPQTCYDLRRP